MSRADLDELYRDGESTCWQYKDGIRQDWLLAKHWLQRSQGGKILDLGCWDGNFLINLPGQWERFGIEIHRGAADRARWAGIKIVGTNLYDSRQDLIDRFDVVTAFDILEHVEDPKILLAKLVECTRPGGYILVGTGNTEAWTWRLAKNRYWYCWPPEHISFVNISWFGRLTEELPFAARSIEKFAHHSNPSVLRLLLQSTANLLYLFAPAVFYKMRRWRWKILRGTENRIADFPPVWDTSRDHMLAILERLPSRAIIDAN